MCRLQCVPSALSLSTRCTATTFLFVLGSVLHILHILLIDMLLVYLYLVNSAVELLRLLHIHGVIHEVIVQNNPPDPVGLPWRLWHHFLEIAKPAEHLHLHRHQARAL